MPLTNTGQGPSQLKFARDRVMEQRATEQAATPVPASPDPSKEDRKVPPGSLGIVVVHGVGAQHRGATLLEWSAPMVRAISRWVDRARKDERLLQPDEPPDQIEQAEVDFAGDNVSFIKISIPKVKGLDGRDYDQQTWVMTEAWWAERVSPPSLSAVIDWCGRQGAVRRIVERTINHLTSGTGTKKPSPFVIALMKIGFGLFVSIATSVVLVVYAVVAALAAIIPIDAVRQAFERFQLNTFLTTWWGDVYLLLRDPVQAANIRDRLITSIQTLRIFGCDRIAVIAHSGGTIVSYTALRDPAFQERVDTLITHGEVIAMGRFMDQQVGADGGIPSSVRLKAEPEQDLRLGIDGHPARWIDFWATHDPAPCGPLDPEMLPNETECVLDQPAWPGTPGNDQRSKQGVQIQNRKSVLDDHGGYWDNDEEFVYPLLMQLEVAGRDVGASRFHPRPPDAPPPADRAPSDAEPRSWVGIRRQRVHALTLWGRLIFVAPFLAMVGDFALPGGGLTNQLADIATTVLNWIPGVGAVASLFSGWSLPDPWQQPVQLVGLLALGAVVGAALIHAALPIGWTAAPWPTRSAWFWIFTGVDYLLSLAALLILVPALFAFGGWIKGNVGVPPPAAGLVVALLLLGLVIVVFLLSDPGFRDGIRALLERFSGLVATIFFVLSAVVIASLVFTLATLPDARRWVLALVTALIAFRLIGTIGRWRWRVWDERERETFRIGNPAAMRTFAYIQMLILLAIVVFAAAIVIGGQSNMVSVLIGVIVAATLSFMARDAVLANQPIRATDRPMTGESPAVAAAATGGAP